MKRRVFFVVIFLVLCNCTYAQWWKRIGSAILGGAADIVLQGSGYSPQESRDIIHTFTDVVGGNSQNVDIGIGFLDADKNTQVNTVVNEVLGATGELTGRTDITNAIQTGVNAGFAAAVADNNNEKVNIIVDGALDLVGDVTGRTDITGVIQKGVDAGFDVVNADNDNEKVSIITGTALDIVGDLTDGHEVTNMVKTYIDNELIYGSDISKAETVEDLQNAVDKKREADREFFYDVGMALYDHMERKNTSSRNEPTINTEPDIPMDDRTPIDSYEILSEPSQAEIGQEKEIVAEVVSQEEQDITDSSEYIETEEAINADSKEPEGLVDQEEKAVVLSDVPQESKPEIEILDPYVSMSRPSKELMYSQESIMEEEGKIEIEDSQTITDAHKKPDKQKAEYPYSITTVSPEFEDSKPAEKNITDILTVPCVPRTFRVQIMATSTPIKNYDSIFIMRYYLYDPMEEEVGQIKGKVVYRYVSEEMRSREEAKALKDYFVERGFKDAWIVEYKGGARVFL